MKKDKELTLGLFGELVMNQLNSMALLNQDKIDMKNNEVMEELSDCLGFTVRPGDITELLLNNKNTSITNYTDKILSSKIVSKVLKWIIGTDDNIENPSTRMLILLGKRGGRSVVLTCVSSYSNAILFKEITKRIKIVRKLSLLGSIRTSAIICLIWEILFAIVGQNVLQIHQPLPLLISIIFTLLVFITSSITYRHISNSAHASSPYNTEYENVLELARCLNAVEPFVNDRDFIINLRDSMKECLSLSNTNQFINSEWLDMV